MGFCFEIVNEFCRPPARDRFAGGRYFRGRWQGPPFAQGERQRRNRLRDGLGGRGGNRKKRDREAQYLQDSVHNFRAVQIRDCEDAPLQCASVSAENCGEAALVYNHKFQLPAWSNFPETGNFVSIDGVLKP
jgi:hypothetical protein